jgi:hypothetical protein
MRRSAAVLAILATLLILAPPVAASPPTKEPFPAATVDLATGEVCAFPVRLEFPIDRVHSITFDRRDGRFVQHLNGHLVARVTNLDTGLSVVRNVSGPAKFTFTEDGHLVLTASGPSLLWFFAGDVTGPGLVYAVGGAVAETDGNLFFFIRVELPHRVEDLCATLATD